MRKIAIILSFFVLTTSSYGVLKETTSFQDSTTCDKSMIINGVKWATRNVDVPGTFAKNPEDVGMFYQWNRKKAWELTDDWITGWDNTVPKGMKWEKENDPSPIGWRIATIYEIKSLFDTDKVYNEWYVVNGVNGRKFTDLVNGNSIFLPAAGFCRGNDGVCMFIREVGYWSSTPCDSNSERAYGLSDAKGQSNEFTEFGTYGRQVGHLVRCVAE